MRLRRRAPDANRTMTSHPNIPERDLELLSAYLDGELSDPDRRALEQRLAAESDLRRALDELRLTVRLVGSLPHLKAPRSFALDPAKYGKRMPWWRRAIASGAVLQWSGALGTAASVIVIALGLTLGNGASVPTQDAQAPSETLSAAPAAASLPTALPVTPTLAPTESELDGAEAEMAVESAEEAAPGLAQAPMIELPSPLSDSAASTFGEPEGFAPPSAASPLPSERGAPPVERFAAGESAEDAADQAEPLAAPEGAQALQVPTATASPAPTATDEAAARRANDALEATAEALKAAPPTEVLTSGEPSDSGPRWWLVALGAAGLAVSAILFLVGRRQAGL